MDNTCIMANNARNSEIMDLRSLDFFRPKEQALNLRVSTVLFSAMLWLQNSSEKDFGTCLFWSSLTVARQVQMRQSIATVVSILIIADRRSTALVLLRQTWFFLTHPPHPSNIEYWSWWLYVNNSVLVWLEGPFKTHVTIKTFLRNLSGLKDEQIDDKKFEFYAS